MFKQQLEDLVGEKVALWSLDGNRKYSVNGKLEFNEALKLYSAREMYRRLHFYHYEVTKITNGHHIYLFEEKK